MRITTFLPAVAIAVLASVAAASATDQFSTRDGIAVAPMNAMELDSVRGSGVALIVVDAIGPDIFVTAADPTGNAPPPLVFIQTRGIVFLAPNAQAQDL